MNIIHAGVNKRVNVVVALASALTARRRSSLTVATSIRSIITSSTHATLAPAVTSRRVAPQQTQWAATVSILRARDIRRTHIIEVLLPDLFVVQSISVAIVERPHDVVRSMIPRQPPAVGWVTPPRRRQPIVQIFAEHVHEGVVAPEQRVVRRTRQRPKVPPYPDVWTGVVLFERAEVVRAAHVVEGLTTEHSADHGARVRQASVARIASYEASQPAVAKAVAIARLGSPAGRHTRIHRSPNVAEIFSREQSAIARDWKPALESCVDVRYAACRTMPFQRRLEPKQPSTTVAVGPIS